MFKKFFIGIGTLLCLVACTLGLVYGVKQDEAEKAETNKTYAEQIEGLKGEINITIETITKLTGDLDILKQENNTLTETVTSYQVQVDTLNGTVASKESEIIEKDKIITDNQNKILTLRETVTNYESQIVELEKGSATYGAEIDNLKQEINSKNAEISSLELENSQLKAKIANLEAEINSLKGIIAERDATITELQLQIKSKEDEKAQLVINIDILNETIIELNAKITVLESALKKDENAMYLADILTSGEVSRYIAVNDNYCLIQCKQRFDGDDFGFYLVDLETSRVVFKKARVYFSRDDKIHFARSNDFIVFPQNQFLVYFDINDLEFKEFFHSKNCYVSDIEVVRDNVFFIAGDHSFFVDLDNESISEYVGDYSFAGAYLYKLDTNDIIIGKGYDSDGVYLLDSDSLEIKLLASKGIGSPFCGGLYNIAVTDNIRYFGLIDRKSFGLYYLDSKEMEVFTFDSIDGCSSMEVDCPFVFDNFIVFTNQNYNGPHVVFDVETKTFVKEYTDYFGSGYYLNFDSVIRSALFCKKTNNGWLFYGNRLWYFDSSSLEIHDLGFDNYNNLFFEMPNGSIFCYGNLGNRTDSMFVFNPKTETGVSCGIGTADVYYRKIAEASDKSGIYIKQYDANNKFIDCCFYNYLTGEITSSSLPSDLNFE